MNNNHQFQREHVNYDLRTSATIGFSEIVFLLDHGYILITPILASFMSISIAVSIIDTLIIGSYSSPVSITLQQISIAGTGFFVELLFFLLTDLVMFLLGKGYNFIYMLRLQAVIYKYISIGASFILTFLSISTKISCEIQLLFLIILISEGAVSTYTKIRNTRVI